MTNCKNCGAPIDKSGVCSYCGTVYAVKFIDKPSSNYSNSFSAYSTINTKTYIGACNCSGAFGHATMAALQRKIRANENIRADTARTTL